MYAELNACMRKRLGACMWILGACLSNVWVHVCGCWVQSMRLLGASLWRRLGACMRLLGACMRKRLGACMRKLGASFITAEGLPDSR